MKVKEILQKWLINNIGYKILAVILAFALWLVIVNIQDQTKTKTITNIPVTIINENALPESEYKYAPTSGTTATIIISGRRSIVDSLSRNDFVATANFQELSLTHAVPIKVELSDEKSQLANYITITQKTMNMVLSLDPIRTKTIDVEVKNVGSLPDGMIVEKTEVSPVRIEIKAPLSVLDNYYKAEATINLQDVTDGATLRATPVFYNYSGYPVELTDDMEVSDEEVTVTFTTNHIKYVDLQINTLGTPADGYELTGVQMSFKQAVLKGAQDVLDKVSYIKIPNTYLPIYGATSNVTIEVNLEDFLPDGTEIYDNNRNVYITAVIEKSETTTTEAETAEEFLNETLEGNEAESMEDEVPQD